LQSFAWFTLPKKRSYTIARQRGYPSGAAVLPRVLLPFCIMQVAVEESAASTVASSREGSTFQNARKGLEVVSGSRAES